MKRDRQTIATRCPVCGAVLPLFDLLVIRQGWWRPAIQVIIEGDATDYVAHLWTHSQEVKA